MAYIRPEITVDPAALSEEAFSYLRSIIPGWEPADGNLDVWLVEALSQVAAQVAETANDVPDSIFRYYGETLLGLTPRQETNATGATTWTLLDSSGYTIPEGATIAVEGADGDMIAFATTEETTVDPGSGSVSGVPVTAVDAGSVGTGLSGEATLVDPLDYVQSVAFDTATTGGQDAETEEEYLNRLAAELRLLTPRPILPEDFATLALRVDGVGRALALDGYDPAGGSYGNERMIALALADSAGQPVSSGVKTAVRALLEGEREANFVVHVIDPTYSPVTVLYKITVWDGFDANAVKDNADAALTAWLNPARWGQPDFGEDTGWAKEDKVRLYEVVSLIDSVEGVRHVTEVKLLAGYSGVGVAADVTLAGAAPLPITGVIHGEVV